MILIAAACRLRSDLPPRPRDTIWQRQPRTIRFLRNLCDLSVPPATHLTFLARCGLLVAFALVCHSLGAGAALFLRAAPIPAMILFGVLFVCATTNWLSRD
jgi:hypothetical protein